MSSEHSSGVKDQEGGIIAPTPKTNGFDDKVDQECHYIYIDYTMMHGKFQYFLVASCWTF
jgi:hypothetical protein